MTESANSHFSFRPLTEADLGMLREWLGRPHVSRWWPAELTLSGIRAEFLPLTRASSTTRGYVALLGSRPIGFVQVYVVEDESDPGARGIDQFLAHADDLGQGIGSRMIRTFVDELFRDPAVTKVQTDPAPNNDRAMRCYVRAGFQPHGEVITPDGPAMLMLRHRGERVTAVSRELNV